MSAWTAPFRPHPPRQAIGIDAFCLIHGTGSNFYGSTLLESLAERLQELGCGVLRANTRGHDGLSTAATSRGGRRQGAAYEVVDDCRHDIAAWVEWLRQHVGPRVGLVGHSLGAVKCLYAMAHQPKLAVAGVVGLSPPRLSYAWFCESPQGSEFLADFRRAEEMVHAGQPGESPGGQTAAAIAHYRGRFCGKIWPRRTLQFPAFPPWFSLSGADNVGQHRGRKQHGLSRVCRKRLAELAGRQPQLRTAIIDGADHFYTGRREEVASLVESWSTKI